MHSKIIKDRCSCCFKPITLGDLDLDRTFITHYGVQFDCKCKSTLQINSSDWMDVLGEQEQVSQAKHMLPKLLKLFDTYSMDTTAYFETETLYTKTKFPIFWLGRGKWRLGDTSESEEVNSKDLVPVLQSESVCLVKFQHQLEIKVMNHIAICNMFFEAVEENLGKEYLDNAIQENKRFSDEIVNAIQGVLAKKKLKVVEDTNG
jgi:hypothetical protein